MRGSPVLLYKLKQGCADPEKDLKGIKILTVRNELVLKCFKLLFQES